MMGLTLRQKQEWKTTCDNNWVRTGCSSIWDAIFMAFREYRETTPVIQNNIIRDKTKIVLDGPTAEDLVEQLETLLMKGDGDGDEDKDLFYYLIPKRLILSDLLPYLRQYIGDNESVDNRKMLYEETLEKCCLLGDYRQKKKLTKDNMIPVEELTTRFGNFLSEIFKTMETPTSYDMVMEAMKNMGNHLIILSPNEKILFDSKTWKEGMDGETDFYDVIMILSHPDGKYDSIGRQSYTKDGHQKISRLFHYDDECIQTLRRVVV